MHTRLRRTAAMVLALLQLEACLKKHLPPENYAIVETVSLGELGPVTVIIPYEEDSGTKLTASK